MRLQDIRIKLQDIRIKLQQWHANLISYWATSNKNKLTASIAILFTLLIILFPLYLYNKGVGKNTKHNTKESLSQPLYRVMEINLNGKAGNIDFTGKALPVNNQSVLILEIQGKISNKKRILIKDTWLDPREVLAFKLPGQSGLYCFNEDQFVCNILAQKAGRLTFDLSPPLLSKFSEFYSYQYQEKKNGTGEYVSAPIRILYRYIEKDQFAYALNGPQKVLSVKPVEKLNEIDKRIVKDAAKATKKIKKSFQGLSKLFNDSLETPSQKKVAPDNKTSTSL